MIDERGAGFFRRSPRNLLFPDDIVRLLADIAAIGADESAFRFNQGPRTSCDDCDRCIYVRGDVYADDSSPHPRARMSERAVLAHEYYGHLAFAPSVFQANDWRDEFRASYFAAVNTPNLTDEDRIFLILDAYERAREHGIQVTYNKKAREILGFDWND